jgi:regulator of nucleoside diphosphate kinase
MRNRIYVTNEDFDRLCRLVRGRRAGHSADSGYLDMLEEELDRAEIVDANAIPPEVVTMNSEVRLKDLDSGEVKVYRLVFPNQSRAENCISILAPVGTAMLGYRVGDTIEWPVPKGIRRLQVLEVVSQPEGVATMTR